MRYQTTTGNTGPMVVLGDGFISQHLAQHLSASGHVVCVLDRRRCDFLNCDQVSDVFRMLPANASFFLTAAVTRLNSNDKISFSQNVQMVENIMNALPESARHIIFFSSVDVYGINPILPIVETTAAEPDDYYAMSKLVCEFVLQKEARKRGVGLTIFRLCGVYGKGDAGKSTVNRMVSSAVNRSQIILIGNPLILRDYIWVDDVAHIAEKACSDRIDGLYNFATGQSLTVFDIATLVASEIKGDISIVCSTDIEIFRASSLQFNINKLQFAFSYFNMMSLKSCLPKYIIDYYTATNLICLDRLRYV